LKQEKPDKSMASAREYSKASIAVAKSLKVPYVDLQTNIMRMNNWQVGRFCP
jgi:hypothetical protein